MALYVGSIKCPFCGREVSKEQRSVHLPQFVWNQADPLFPFGDATVHEECLKNDPLAPKVRVRYREFEEKNTAQNRLCFICGKPITDPEDYLGLGYLSADANDPLFRFNYAHFHRSCLPVWSELPFLIHELERLDRSGSCKGGGLQQLVKELRKADPTLGFASPT
jgi:hypothetical protein